MWRQWLEGRRTDDRWRASAFHGQARHFAAGKPKTVWAVPCDCTEGNRAERALAKARVPERYRHCDFDNYETDNEIEGAVARCSMHGRAACAGKTGCAEIRAGIFSGARLAERARFAADGPVRRGQNAFIRRGAEGNCAAGALRAFLRLPRTAEGNSG